MRILVALALLAVSCAGAPGEPDCDGQGCEDLKAGSFALSPSSAAATAQVGARPAAVSATLTDKTTAGHGFRATCTGGLTATPASGAVTHARPAAISFQAAAPQAAGTSTATCQLDSTSGSSSHAVFSFKLTAQGATGGDFALAISPASQTISAGSSATYSISTSGSLGPIALAVQGLPAGVSGALQPASVAAGQPSTLTVTASSSAPAASATFQVTGAAGSVSHAASGALTVTSTSTGQAIHTVWIVMMENHNWSQIKGNPSAPYINQTLLPLGAHAEQYFNPPHLHPSEPNYLWLEAGTNFGVLNDSPPSSNHQASTLHLATLLEAKGLSWKSYQEDISGASCPLTNTGKYAPKHNPFVFFDDVANSARCVAHVRPYSELAGDLQAGRVASYNFLTPNLCNDMHDSSGCATSDAVKNGDTWLSHNLPAILSSAAYQAGGAIFITWDESENGDNPIGMIVLSSQAKAGYASTRAFSHSSTLRTMQEIFGVTPLLGDAANASDLSDLFRSFP